MSLTESTTGELVTRAELALMSDEPIDKVRLFVSSVLAELVSRIEAGAPDDFVLPVSITDAIRKLFGGGKQTFDAMTRRCRFALKVWDGKYGPLNPEQAAYAETLLGRCFVMPAGCDNPRAAAYSKLSKIVNHEVVHAGMKARADAGVDILGELDEALS